MLKKWIRFCMFVILGITLFFALFWGMLTFFQRLMPSPKDLQPAKSHPQASAVPEVSPPISQFPSTSIFSPTPTPPPPAAPIFPNGIVQKPQDTVAFRATIHDLIACYNHRWGIHYLDSVDTWQHFPNVTTPCAGITTARYRFLSDANIHYWPPIDVYCCPDDWNIREISLSLSEHDWNQKIDDIFVEQSLCMLSVFHSDLAYTQVQKLYSYLRQDAIQNAYVSHNATPKPLRVYIHGNVACWGYTYSGMIHINIVPANDTLLALLAAQGAAILQTNEVIYANNR